MDLSMSQTAALHQLATRIEQCKTRRLLCDASLLADAVMHFVAVCRSFKTATSARLLHHARLYKQHLDEATEEYTQGRDFDHYYYFILDVGHEIHTGNDDDAIVNTLAKYEAKLKASLKERQRAKNSRSLAKKQRQLRELATQYGLGMAGHTSKPGGDVLCYDAKTGERLDLRTMLVKGIDDIRTPQPEEGVCADTPPQSVPLPSIDNPFPPGFVTTKMVIEENFKVLDHGTVYGFARAPNGIYAMVYAVQFSPLESLTEVEREAVDVFAEYVPNAVEHGYEVKGNKAQNAENDRHGGLYSSGWRPGTTEGEKCGEYCIKSDPNHDPDGYADLYEKQPVVNVAWRTLQEGLSPRAVLTTVDTLSDIAVPLFGSHDVNIENHGPSLGSNMAVSKHDARGRNLANGIHVHRDIDSLPVYYGKLFTFGLWLHTNSEGQLIDGQRIRDAIPEGLFILPGYRVAFDLGATAVVRAIWRGGMDVHGTTTSTVAIEKGITRWGMSIQTNRSLVQRLRSGKGEIFGAYERLKRYYDALS